MSNRDLPSTNRFDEILNQEYNIKISVLGTTHNVVLAIFEKVINQTGCSLKGFKGRVVRIEGLESENYLKTHTELLKLVFFIPTKLAAEVIKNPLTMPDLDETNIYNEQKTPGRGSSVRKSKANKGRTNNRGGTWQNR